ncbi:hypothetical protein EV363DRAFT_1294389 [Boletus edulis]|nr:hypothetical protein EV363DRAFT_1294389 [Boletus edulis]
MSESRKLTTGEYQGYYPTYGTSDLDNCTCLSASRLLHICDIDIDEIHDDDALHAWHQSIDHTHFNSSEILGYVLILRSTAKLEQGIHSDLQLIMSSIGNKEHMVQHTKDQNGKAQQSKRDKVQEDSQRGNSGDEGQIDNGRTQVEVDDETCTERPYEMVSKYGSGDEYDSTTSITDGAVKRKRVSSTASAFSEGTASQKNKHHDNPLVSIEMDSIFHFPDDLSASDFGNGLEHHMPTHGM